MPTGMTQLTELLSHLNEVRGSDLHLKPGAPPHVRVDGQLRPAPFEALAPGAVEALVDEVLDETRQTDLAATGETGSGLSVPGLGRFRVAVHRQRGSLAMVVRRVPPEIPKLDELRPQEGGRRHDVAPRATGGRGLGAASLPHQRTDTRSCAGGEGS